MPAISQVSSFAYESSPESTQNFISWIALKIKTFFLWIWYGLIDFLKSVIRAVMGEIDKYPTDNPSITPIEPDKNKYGDIHNKIYLSELYNKLDEYKYYLIVSFIVIIGGAVVYFYWDSIAGCWRRRRPDGDTGDAGPLPEYEPSPQPERPASLPSVSSDSSGSYNQYFRKNLFDKLNRFKEKTKNFFTPKRVPRLDNIPRGIYLVNGKDMYNGLPLPRVEILPNGTEYYFAKDDSGFLEVMSDNFSGSGTVDIVNPFTNSAVTSHAVSVNERISFINRARGNAIFEAPENSYARHPIFEFNQGDLSRPSISSTSASSSSLPGDIDDMDNVPLTDKGFREALLSRLNKGKNKETSIPENINPEMGAFNTPIQQTYNLPDPDLTPKAPTYNLPKLGSEETPKDLLGDTFNPFD